VFDFFHYLFYICSWLHALARRVVSQKNMQKGLFMSLLSKEIRVVAADVGGLQAWLPSLQWALAGGYKVRLCCIGTVADPKKLEKLRPDPRIETEIAENVIQVGRFVDSLQLLTAVATSQSELGAQAAAIAVTHSKAPVIMLEDMYLSSCETLCHLRANDALSRIGRLCVIDDQARDLLINGGFGVDDRIEVTGGPQFDYAMGARMAFADLRDSLRSELGVGRTYWPTWYNLVFLVVGGKAGTVEILQLLETVIEKSGMVSQVKVVFRPHPGASAEEQQAVEAYSRESRLRFWDVNRSLAPTSDAVLPAADCVLSSFGTTNHLGILLGMRGVVYIGTPSCKAYLRSQKNLDRPPEVTAGAGWYVETPDQLTKILVDLAFYHSAPPREVPAVDALNKAQAAMMRYADGRAAERVWTHMQNLLR
jgi:hypothetical protein